MWTEFVSHDCWQASHAYKIQQYAQELSMLISNRDSGNMKCSSSNLLLLDTSFHVN